MVCHTHKERTEKLPPLGVMMGASRLGDSPRLHTHDVMTELVCMCAMRQPELLLL